MYKVLKKIDSLQLEIDALQQADTTLRKRARDFFRISLTYSSNALDGNSLTEAETKTILENGIAIGGKPLQDHLEAVGLSQAFEALYTLTSTRTITEHDVKGIHRLFYQKIDDKKAGKYRGVRISAAGSKRLLPAPEAVPGLMAVFPGELAVMRGKVHPVEAAALAHKNFDFIHPFIDGNRRVARLLLNLVLMQDGFLPALIPPAFKNEYMEATQGIVDDDRKFIRFITEMVLETQKVFIKLFGN
jgi:Fic family protein